MPEQPKSAAVGPMQVVSVEEQSFLASQVRKDLCNGIEEKQTLFVWRQLGLLGKRTESGFDLGSKFGYLPGRITQGGSQYDIVFLFPHPAPKSLNEGQVGRGSFVFITPSAEYNGTVDGRLNGNLARQPRLTSARLATQKNAVAAAFACPMPQIASLQKLRGTPDKAAPRKSVKDSHRRCRPLFAHIVGN